MATPHYGLDRSRGRGSIPYKGVRFYSAPKRPNWFWGPLSLLLNENQGHSPDGKLAGCGATCSPPYSAEGKNDWNYILCSIRLHDVHRTLLLQYEWVRNQYESFIEKCVTQRPHGSTIGLKNFNYLVGRSRVRFPMVSLEFFIDIPLAELWPWGWLSL